MFAVMEERKSLGCSEFLGVSLQSLVSPPGVCSGPLWKVGFRYQEAGAWILFQGIGLASWKPQRGNSF